MKWRNHRLTTGVIAFACTGHLLPVIFASLGSIFPDAIEGHDYTSDHWKRNHRRQSHFLPAYLLATLLFAGILHGNVAQDWTPLIDILRSQLSFDTTSPSYYQPLLPIVGKLFLYGSFWFSFGASMHIFEDAMCGKVPIYSIRHRIGLRMFYVGTSKETLYAWSIIIFALAIRGARMSIMDIPFFCGI